MSNSAPPLRTHSALRLRQLRQRAGLSRADLAALSGVRLDFIGALENDHLGRLLSDHEIEAALQKWAELGPQRLMQRTLLRWADDLHRLADALAETFENLFPAAELAALSDHLWLKIQAVQHGVCNAGQITIWPANPWHAWGWFQNVALSDELPADRTADPAEMSALDAAIRTSLAQLGPRERLVLTLHYGFDGPNLTLTEIGQQLGLTREAVRRLEHHALRRLKHPKSSRRLRDYLDCFN